MNTPHTFDITADDHISFFFQDPATRLPCRVLYKYIRKTTSIEALNTFPRGAQDAILKACFENQKSTDTPAGTYVVHIDSELALTTSRDNGYPISSISSLLEDYADAYEVERRHIEGKTKPLKTAEASANDLLNLTRRSLAIAKDVDATRLDRRNMLMSLPDHIAQDLLSAEANSLELMQRYDFREYAGRIPVRETGVTRAPVSNRKSNNALVRFLQLRADMFTNLATELRHHAEYSAICRVYQDHVVAMRESGFESYIPDTTDDIQTAKAALAVKTPIWNIPAPISPPPSPRGAAAP